MSPSSEPRPVPTAEEVAAILAALGVVLGHRASEPPETPAWRWSGRRWQWSPGQAGATHDVRAT